MACIRFACLWLCQFPTANQIHVSQSHQSSTRHAGWIRSQWCLSFFRFQTGQSLHTRVHALHSLTFCLFAGKFQSSSTRLALVDFQLAPSLTWWHSATSTSIQPSSSCHAPTNRCACPTNGSFQYIREGEDLRTVTCTVNKHFFCSSLRIDYQATWWPHDGIFCRAEDSRSLQPVPTIYQCIVVLTSDVSVSMTVL